MGGQGSQQERKQLCVGLLAHVDAGKTTLSEGLLYASGHLRRLGRVDHQDAFLDTDDQERERGITIFSKQARLSLDGLDLTLLDTPGHVDFSSEMERTLQVLDYAILVISGTDGVQGHTTTLWRLLARYHIPTFLFVNKMDLAGTDRAALLEQLRSRLSGGCVDFSAPDWEESAALCDEGILEKYLEEGALDDGDVISLIRHRKVFPCWFGSALKMDGVAELLQGIGRYAVPPLYPKEFGAKVFKIARDPQGARLTYLKVTGGSLRVKALLTNRSPSGPEPAETFWEEKADQLRLYSGPQYRLVETVPAGTVCAVTGLSHTYPGQGLGVEPESSVPLLEPVLSYQVCLPEGANVHAVLRQLSQLEEEDPQLHIAWDESAREIRLQLMGQVQLEVLRRLIQERFGLEVAFGAGSVLYKETILEPVEGVGHFEPLRHYAEVHLLLEPGELGSGLRFDTACSEDQLDRNWQRLILTHLAEKEHRGVLTGAPITDMKITLVAGRAHVKHTEGGDFRQATYRAVRQGLKCGRSILLEPWYDLRLEVPADQLGRAMADIQRMGGTFQPPESLGEMSLLTGSVPVSEVGDYALQVASYTRGLGRLSCVPAGYRPCHHSEVVIAAANYDSDRDVDNPADSVFCDHGAGFVVRWDQVRDYMHVDSGLSWEAPEEEEAPAPVVSRRGSVYSGSLEADEELKAIFERTYGPIQRRDLRPQPKPRKRDELPERQTILSPQEIGPEYLLVDGYNIIFAWDELKAISQDNLDAARQRLMDILSNYQGYRHCEIILVFDAYKVPRGVGEVSRYHNIYVVYTKEAETADAYIEKATYALSRKKHRVRVATSDNAEQLIILGHGALRVPAAAFHAEVEQAAGQIAALLAQQNRTAPSKPIQAAMERARQQRNQ
ncbi:MAG: TetM/TetW/TetO/TetS family tetracycline resistance ribosomal protection protein [Oscillospiraceae bacterium]|jgi:ribosomal protection tetracycline resistance protein|nr:TetM/TetW/TetO/TetS family tetracycline resistance ribosomal protection protein [Oscillospiraceae bacterium]